MDNIKLDPGGKASRCKGSTGLRLHSMIGFGISGIKPVGSARRELLSMQSHKHEACGDIHTILSYTEI
jgi:hypothetical protein